MTSTSEVATTLSMVSLTATKIVGSTLSEMLLVVFCSNDSVTNHEEEVDAESGTELPPKSIGNDGNSAAVVISNEPHLATISVPSKSEKLPKCSLPTYNETKQEIDDDDIISVASSMANKDDDTAIQEIPSGFTKMKSSLQYESGVDEELAIESIENYVISRSFQSVRSFLSSASNVAWASSI